MRPTETRTERLLYDWCGLVALAAAVVLVLRVWRTAGSEGLVDLVTMAVGSLLLLGKFVIFLPLHGEATRFSPWSLALMVWLIDLLIAFALSSGFESLERAPLLGSWLRRARRRATLVLRRYPRLERMAFLGVVAYVLFPLAATGAVTGSFAARLCGLSRLTGLLAVGLGSLGTALAFALLAELAGERAEELLRSPLVSGILLLLLVVLGRVAYLRITKLLEGS